MRKAGRRGLTAKARGRDLTAGNLVLREAVKKASRARLARFAGTAGLAPEARAGLARVLVNVDG